MDLPPAQPLASQRHDDGRAVGFWRSDFSSRSFSVEPRWRQSRGLELQEGVDSSLRWLQMVHPDDRAVYTAAEQSLRQARERDVNLEYRVQAQGRGWFWVAQRGQVVAQGADGRPCVAAGVIVDIDGEKKARLALAAAAAQRDAALWAGELGLYEWDLGHDAWRWANGWCHEQQIDPVTGPDAAARWLTLVHPEERASLAAAFEEIRNGTRSETGTNYRVRTRDGRWLWLNERIRIQQLDAQGRAVAAMGLRRNIDEQQRERARSREFAETIAVVGAHCASWVALVDPQGICRFANRGILGFESAALVGQPIAQIWPAKDRDRLNSLFERALSQAEALHAELAHEGFGPGELVLEIKLCPVTEAGATTGVVLSATDITQRRALERELVEATEREQQRIGIELHDGIGQELTGAALMLQSCLHRLRSTDPALAGELENATAQLQRAIRGTRALAHGLAPLGIGAGGLAVALAGLVRRLDRSCGVQVNYSQRLDELPPIAPQVQRQMLRIAQEAINNALKHSDATVITVDLGAAEGDIYVSVHDNGRGFPDAQSAAFGLGMQSMRHRAKLIGADLRFFTAPGQGVTIACRCPISCEQSSSNSSGREITL